MAAILHLDASPRKEASVSRALAREFMEARKNLRPGDTVAYRDLALNPPPYIDEAWIGAAYGPDPGSPESRRILRASDALIDELLAADRLVLSTPMHNFNVPAALKSWIDNVVRPGRTFTFASGGLKGLLPAGLRALVITARGGAYAPGTAWAANDHQEPFLKTVFGFMGLKDVTFVHAEGLNLGPESAARGIEEARRRLSALAESW